MVYHTSFTSQRVRSEASWSLGQGISMKFQILSERIPFAGQGTTCSLPLTDSKASPHRLILVVFKGGKAPLPVSPQYRQLSTLSFMCVCMTAYSSLRWRMCIYVYINVGSEENLGCRPQERRYPPPLKQDLSLTWSSPIRLAALASGSPGLGLQAHATVSVFLCRFWGLKTPLVKLARYTCHRLSDIPSERASEKRAIPLGHRRDH